jgi:ubiquinol-cytochrome c reductase cytochrome c subunit
MPEGELTGPQRREASPAAASSSGQLPSLPRFGSAAVRCPPASTRRRWSRRTPREIYAAMLTGPQNMPVFGDNQLTPDEKRAMIGYIQALQSDKRPGGLGTGRYGPVPEGLSIFLVGIVALVFATLWIAGKS